MDDLRSELSELKNFIAELKADRAAQKKKEKREAWTKYTSLSLVFLAVFAALATQWAGKYSSRVLVNLNDATFHEAVASDEWGFYQAKSIKQSLYEMARDQMKAGSTSSPPSQLDMINARIAKYDLEKKETQEKARRLEEQRDESRKAASIASEHGGRMGLAVSIFQMSVAMASICLVTKKKPLWYFSLLLMAIGVGQMIHAWTM